MTAIRFFGPTCQMKHWLDVDDGTNARAPAPRPGPVNTASSRSVLTRSSGFPAGTKTGVIEAAKKFLLPEEDCPPHPYWPGGESGVTFGVGWDAGQHTAEELKSTWSALDAKGLEALAKAAGKKGEEARWVLQDMKTPKILEELASSASLIASASRDTPDEVIKNFKDFETAVKKQQEAQAPENSPVKAIRVLAAGVKQQQEAHSAAGFDDIKAITIPKHVALKVFADGLPRYYDAALKLFPGMDQLPTGVQVALISLVYNRGPKMGEEDEILDRRWEMRRIRQAVLLRDINWIYDEFGHMLRLWAGTEIERGMQARREHERALISPYLNRVPFGLPEDPWAVERR